MGAYLDLPGFKSRTLMPPADVDRLARIRWGVNVGDALASNPTPETLFGTVVSTGELVTAIITAQAAIAANASNYATLSVFKRTAGGASVLLASLSTAATPIPQGVPVALVLNAGAPITADDAITGSIVKTGTGVIVPAFNLDLQPSPSFIESKIATEQAYIEARLRKRYAIPLDAAGIVPETVCRWLTALVTRACYGRRGFNPTSEQDVKVILEAATTAEAEIKEAADSKDGLFDLPLAQGISPDQSGIIEPLPFAVAEQSPYTAGRVQRRLGRREDSRGGFE